MAYGYVKEIVKIPDGVTVNYDGEKVKVNGPGGTLERDMKNPKLSIDVASDHVLVHSSMPKRRHYALLGTWAAHIANMVRGVTEGFEYNMKIVYSHFPMKVNVKGDKLIIDNFIGEKFPRKANILPGVKLKVNGQDITVTGMDIEKVGQTCANIEMATKIRGYDRRIFQDGIYITRKG